MKDILILGAGGFSKEVHHLIRQIGGYNILGFIHEKPRSSIVYNNQEFVIYNEIEALEFDEQTCIAIGIGEPLITKICIQPFLDKFQFPNLIHPSVIADWGNIITGIGNVFTAKVMLTTNIKIGSFNIFNLSCTIGHDVSIGDYNVFNPRVNISGGVEIGNDIFIGSSATILQYIKIENNSVIGASSFVNKYVYTNSIVAGVPARQIESNKRKITRTIEPIKILTLENQIEWENLLNQFPEKFQDIYFTPEYLKIQENEGYGKAFCFTFKKGNNIALYPFLKNKISSEKFKLNEKYFDIETPYGYGGPILNSDNQKFTEDFYEAFHKYCVDSNIIAEFVRYHPFCENFPNKKYIPNFKDRNTVIINLTKNYYDIWEKEYHSKNRNIIRKAQNGGMKIHIISHPSLKDIEIFSEIYLKTMKKLNADEFYFFSSKYIRNTFVNLSKNTYLFNVLNKENEIVCTSIFFHYQNNFHYHLSARTEKSDNTVNNFLIDSAIQFAQSIGCLKLHLGGGRTNHEEDTLLKFKQSFSKDKGEFYIGKKIHNETIYNHVINEWETQNPDKKEDLKNILLRYKF